ncbi:MAG: response regulator transcription factor [Opitutaceae bacterium]|jgi:DNA-binding NarL/FixJ family response regulator|nr:response regulator transcription factor [Opitutaceae bacterium]
MPRVLVIDDDPRLRRQCAALLRAEAFETAEAGNGKIGLEMARAEPPDLIVCDVNMPGMNGHAALDALRGDPHTMGIPFIFLTANGDMEDLRVGMNLGADDYLVKPVDPDQLIAAVHARLQRAKNAGARNSRPLEQADPTQLESLGLTPREAEVLFWVAQGKTNPEIGIITAVKLTTVKKHLESVYQKLGVDNRTAAATMALESLGPLE